MMHLHMHLSVQLIDCGFVVILHNLILVLTFPPLCELVLVEHLLVSHAIFHAMVTNINDLNHTMT